MVGRVLAQGAAVSELWEIAIALGLLLIFREAVHQFIKSQRFKKVCAFLEKASR